MKHKKINKVLLLVFVITILSITSVNAASYNFSFDDSNHSAGDMNYSSRAVSTGALSNAYVYPAATTISTIYFVTPTSGSYTQATQTVYISARTKKFFTWYSGYGGRGNYYYLAGWPNPDNGTYSGYNISGTWYI